MLIKILMTLALFASGHAGWYIYQQLTKDFQINSERYRYVGDQLAVDGQNSVRGLDRVHIANWREIIPQGLDNLSAFEVVESQRTLKFEAQIYAFELLLPAEQLYMEKRKEVLIKARAFLYGQEECKRLKAIIASSCKIKNMEISQDKTDFIRIDYELGFVQNSPFGALDDNGNLRYAEENAHFYKRFKNSYRTLEEQEKIRINHYEKIEKYCEKVRVYIGTCAIDDISFQFVSIDDDESHKNALEVDALLTSLVLIENYEAEY